jgi:hypothetical protein
MTKTHMEPGVSENFEKISSPATMAIATVNQGSASLPSLILPLPSLILLYVAARRSNTSITEASSMSRSASRTIR